MVKKFKFRAGIANCSEYLELIQLVLDDEASKNQDLYLKRHFRICPDCLNHLKLDKEVKKAIRLKLSNKTVPADLVDSIKNKIAKSA